MQLLLFYLKWNYIFWQFILFDIKLNFIITLVIFLFQFNFSYITYLTLFEKIIRDDVHIFLRRDDHIPIELFLDGMHMFFNLSKKFFNQYLRFFFCLSYIKFNKKTDFFGSVAALIWILQFCTNGEMISWNLHIF
jgi:hypothetical protein